MLARYFEGPVPSLPQYRAAAIISRAVKFIGWGIADNRTLSAYASSGGIILAATEKVLPRTLCFFSRDFFLFILLAFENPEEYHPPRFP